MEVTTSAIAGAAGVAASALYEVLRRFRHTGTLRWFRLRRGVRYINVDRLTLEKLRASTELAKTAEICTLREILKGMMSAEAWKQYIDYSGMPEPFRSIAWKSARLVLREFIGIRGGSKKRLFIAITPEEMEALMLSPKSVMYLLPDGELLINEYLMAWQPEECIAETRRKETLRRERVRIIQFANIEDLIKILKRKRL